MKVVIDMNLSPQWIKVFHDAGFEAKHWSAIGNPADPDWKIMLWAKDNGFVVFTHDLDFSALLAATHADFPSVFQLRDIDVSPESQGKFVTETLTAFTAEINAGCLVTMDRIRQRIRLLPII